MARAICTARMAPFVLNASETRTLIQLEAPTNTGVAWLRAVVSFEGVTVTDKPFEIQILKQTTAGTGGNAATEVLVTGPGASITPLGVALVGEWATTEPTAGDIIDSKYVHPQSGYEYVFQEGQDEVTYAGARVALRVITPTGVAATNVTATLWWEE